MKDIVYVQKSRAGDPRLHCIHQCNVFLEKTTTAQVQRVCAVGLVSVWKRRCCVKNPRKCCRGSDALQRKHAQNLPGLNGVGGCPGRIVPGGRCSAKAVMTGTVTRTVRIVLQT